MKLYRGFQVLLALLAVLGSVQLARAENAVSIGKEWSKSGFGSSITYRCKQPSCGGKKSIMKVENFGGVSGAPELGIPEGSNLEAEFRRRPEVRRILGAMLQQLAREPSNKGSQITTTYFANSSHAGFNISLAGANKKNEHAIAQLRIKDNKVLLAVSTAESAQMSRRNFKALLPTLGMN